MKVIFSTVISLLLINGLSGIADAQLNPVPRCWQSDQPNQEIDDGVFLFEIQTRDISASQVAFVLEQLQGSLGTQANVGSSVGSGNIEIAMVAPQWVQGTSYPTLDILKNQVISDYSRAASLPYVSVHCSSVLHLGPRPGGSVSNAAPL